MDSPIYHNVKIIDLASGKGQDLFRYFKSASNIVCVDKDPVH